MPIRAYLPTSGASFSPESVTNMGTALDGAVDILGIEPRDETKREAVARFIIKLAEVNGGVDAASLRDKAVMALRRLDPSRFTVKGRTTLMPTGPKGENRPADVNARR